MMQGEQNVKFYCATCRLAEQSGWSDVSWCWTWWYV